MIRIRHLPKPQALAPRPRRVVGTHIHLTNMKGLLWQ